MDFKDNVFILNFSATKLISLSKKKSYYLKNNKLWRKVILLTTIFFVSCFGNNKENFFDWVIICVLGPLMEYIVLNILANFIRFTGKFEESQE